MYVCRIICSRKKKNQNRGSVRYFNVIYVNLYVAIIKIHIHDDRVVHYDRMSSLELKMMKVNENLFSVGFVLLNLLFFWTVFCRLYFVLAFFHLAIVLSVLRFTASNYMYSFWENCSLFIILCVCVSGLFISFILSAIVLCIFVYHLVNMVCTSWL